MEFCTDNGCNNCGGLMVRSKRISEEPTLLDLYAAMASIGLIQRYGSEALPAFVAKGSFEIAQAMMEQRAEILKEKP